MQNIRLAHMAVMVKQDFVLIGVLISLDLGPDDGGLVVFAFYRTVIASKSVPGIVERRRGCQRRRSLKVGGTGRVRGSMSER
jgi:hypothetical protein